jgi:hypothetical protein
MKLMVAKVIVTHLMTMLSSSDLSSPSRSISIIAGTPSDTDDDLIGLSHGM